MGDGQKKSGGIAVALVVGQKKIGSAWIDMIQPFDIEINPGQLNPHATSQTPHPVQEVRIASEGGVNNTNWPYQKKIGKNTDNHEECPGHAL